MPASVEKIRLADIDTPETYPPRWAAERRAGEAATLRMQALLNAGPFTLGPIKRDVDRYGRKLRVVERDGASLAARTGPAWPRAAVWGAASARLGVGSARRKRQRDLGRPEFAGPHAATIKREAEWP